MINDNMDKDGNIDNKKWFEAIHNQNITPGPNDVSPNWLVMRRNTKSGIIERLENYKLSADHIQNGPMER